MNNFLKSNILSLLHFPNCLVQNCMLKLIDISFKSISSIPPSFLSLFPYYLFVEEIGHLFPNLDFPNHVSELSFNMFLCFLYFL